MERRGIIGAVADDDQNRLARKSHRSESVTGSRVGTKFYKAVAPLADQGLQGLFSSSRTAVSAATASALAFSAVSILSQLSLNSVCRMRSSGSQRDSVLTHAVTHEQKKRGGNNGEKRICG